LAAANIFDIGTGAALSCGHMAAPHRPLLSKSLPFDSDCIERISLNLQPLSTRKLHKNVNILQKLCAFLMFFLY
jgi:hypothetical protein